MRPPRKIKGITIFLTILVIGVLIYIFTTNYNELSSFPWEINFYMIILLLIVHTIAMLPTFVAWHLMVSKIGQFDNLKANLKYYYLSALAKRLPTSIPYIGGRMYLYGQDGISNAAILNCSILETLLFSIAGIIAYLLIHPFYKSNQSEISLLVAIIGVVFTLVIFLWPRFLFHITNWFLFRFNKPPLISFPERKDLVLWISIYIIPWFISGYAFYLVPKALSTQISINFIDAYEITTISTLASQLYIILPGGLAIREFTASVLLTQFTTIPLAVVISIGFRITQTINEIITAVVLVLITQRHIETQ